MPMKQEGMPGTGIFWGCSWCPKSFINKETAKRHEQKVHYCSSCGTPSIYRKKCTICGKRKKG